MRAGENGAQLGCLAGTSSAQARARKHSERMASECVTTGLDPPRSHLPPAIAVAVERRHAVRVGQRVVKVDDAVDGLRACRRRVLRAAGRRAAVRDVRVRMIEHEDLAERAAGGAGVSAKQSVEGRGSCRASRCGRRPRVADTEATRLQRVRLKPSARPIGFARRRPQRSHSQAVGAGRIELRRVDPDVARRQQALRRVELHGEARVRRRRRQYRRRVDCEGWCERVRHAGEWDARQRANGAYVAMKGGCTEYWLDGRSLQAATAPAAAPGTHS